MMESAAATLAWALGEADGFQRVVDEMRRRARDYVASG
jgi:hypothetical protein